jgi:toxin ParE1/3/4
MSTYKIVFRPLAELDLLHLFDFIAQESGAQVADEYIDRIEAACLALERFPMRGTKRDDISPGLRILGFERRAPIAFRVGRGEVAILRVLYGGRDYVRILAATAT